MTGEVGSAFGTEPVARRAEIAEFDWTSVHVQFDLYIFDQHVTLPVKPKKVRKTKARRMIWDFYSANRATMPEGIVAGGMTPAVQPRLGSRVR